MEIYKRSTEYNNFIILFAEAWNHFEIIWGSSRQAASLGQPEVTVSHSIEISFMKNFVQKQTTIVKKRNVDKCSVGGRKTEDPRLWEPLFFILSSLPLSYIFLCFILLHSFLVSPSLVFLSLFALAFSLSICQTSGMDDGELCVA